MSDKEKTVWNLADVLRGWATTKDYTVSNSIVWSNYPMPEPEKPKAAKWVVFWVRTLPARVSHLLLRYKIEMRDIQTVDDFRMYAASGTLFRIRGFGKKAQRELLDALNEPIDFTVSTEKAILAYNYGMAQAISENEHDNTVLTALYAAIDNKCFTDGSYYNRTLISGLRPFYLAGLLGNSAVLDELEKQL